MEAGQLADIFSGLSILAAAVYGFALLTKPVSGPRTVIKAASVAGLAGVSLVLHGPWLLTLPLLLSALGDAFMAGSPKPWLPFGLAAFLVAHLLYVALFSHSNLHPQILMYEPARGAVVAAAAAAAVAVLLVLWGELRRMREAVVIYSAVVVMMVAMAMTLPWDRSAAMIGAALFMTSDAVLAFRLFRGGGPNVSADLAVWWFYWAGQALIARAFLHGARH